MERYVTVEQYQDRGEFVLRGDIGPIDPARDLDVSVSGQVLRIYADRSRLGEHGRFIHLPADVTGTGMRCTYDDGILEVRLPRERRRHAA